MKRILRGKKPHDKRKRSSLRRTSVHSPVFWSNMTGKEKAITLSAVLVLILLGIVLILLANNKNKPQEIISKHDPQTSESLSESLEESSSRSPVQSIQESSADREESSSTAKEHKGSYLPPLTSEDSSSKDPLEKVEILVQEGSLQESSTKTDKSEDLDPDTDSEIPPSEEDEDPASESLSSSVDLSETSSENGGEGGESSEDRPSDSGENSPEEGGSSAEPDGHSSAPDPASEIAGESDSHSATTSEHSSSDPASEDLGESLSEKQPEEPDDTKPAEEAPDSYGELAQKTRKIPGFHQQSLGANPVYQYSHPNLDLVLDFRDDFVKARDIYVLPMTNGFYVIQRQMLSLYNLTPSELVDRVEKEGIEGAMLVRIVSGEQKAELEATDPTVLFRDYSGEKYIAIRGLPVDESKLPKVFDNFADQMIDIDYISQHVDSGIADGGKTPDADMLDPAAQWKNMVDQFEANPAQAEWDYNLPLYAPSNGYQVDGVDQRALVLKNSPAYNFAMVDLNGDGNYEYLVNARTGLDEAEGVQGYWAIYTSSDKGLLMVAKSMYGNGDLIRQGNFYTLTSQEKRADLTRLNFESFSLPKTDSSTSYIDFLQPEGFMETMTGKDLAAAYPDHYIVGRGEHFYLVDRHQYDTVISEFISETTDGFLYRGSDSVTMKRDLNKLAEGQAGKTGADGEPVAAEIIPVDDPIVYLNEAYPNLPFDWAIWDSAVPVSDFADHTQVLLPKDLK